MRGVVCPAMVAGLLVGLATAEPGSGFPVVQVRIVAALVGPDLSLKPVPRAPLRICDEPDCAEPILCSTTFEGEARVLLEPGRYTVESRDAVTFRGKSYTWRVPLTVTAGAAGVLELSGDNAVVADLSPEEAANDPVIEPRLYERARGGVFRIEAEAGSGSGFLVHPTGLVLTNHHVVRDSEYLAVRLGKDRKVRATLVADDPAHDLAVLRVHPSTIAERHPLELAWDEAERPPVRVGDRVVALADPFTSEAALTAGVVSKIERDAILSDAAMKPGNSGGPLLRADGAVVAVNTFGSRDRVGASIGGSVRAWRARWLVDRARTPAAAAEPPSADPLPVEPPGVAFEILLAAVRARPPDPDRYDLRLGSVRIRVMTPALMALGGSEGLGRAGGAEEPLPVLEFLDRRLGEQIRPVATVVAVARSWPEQGDRRGIERLELRRDGRAIDPIHPGRYEVRLLERGTGVYFLGYEYGPEAFAPGSSLELAVWEYGSRQPRTREVPPELRERIWGDFAAYRDAGERGP